MNLGGTLVTSQKKEIVVIPPPGPPFTANSADNGLSVDPVGGEIVLGNDVGGNSAALLSDRRIPMNGNNIEMHSPGLGNDKLHFQANEFYVDNAAARLSMVANALNWFDLVGGTSSERIYSVAGGINFINEQLGGTSSGYRLDLTNGRICFGNNVVDPTAILHLLGGVNTAGGAPFKYTAGVAAQTALENGAKNFNGTNEFLTAGGVNYTMAKTLTATAVLDFPNTAAGTSSDLTINLTNAALGDVVLLGVPNASTVANGCFTAWVSAAGVVTVRFTNNDLLTAFNPASGTFRVAVVRY